MLRKDKGSLVYYCQLTTFTIEVTTLRTLDINWLSKYMPFDQKPFGWQTFGQHTHSQCKKGLGDQSSLHQIPIICRHHHDSLSWWCRHVIVSTEGRSTKWVSIKWLDTVLFIILIFQKVTFCQNCKMWPWHSSHLTSCRSY